MDRIADEACGLMRPNAKRQAPEGLNENYARELMELHTVGVNGGYTQADVTQVARVLTGWTVDRPQFGGAAEVPEQVVAVNRPAVQHRHVMMLDRAVVQQYRRPAHAM